MLDSYFGKIKNDPNIIIGHEEISSQANYENVMLVSEWIAKHTSKYQFPTLFGGNNHEVNKKHTK